jgi:WD40 repeat protein
MFSWSKSGLMGALRCQKVLLLVPLLLFLQTADAKKPDKIGKTPDSLPQGNAKDLLKRLRQRFKETRPDRERLRLDLLALCRTFPGSKESVEAFALLRELPSPLDKLDGRAIPALERYDWQPKGLVAVLGEHRGRQGYPVSSVAWSPNGKWIASGGTSLVRLWDPSTLRLKGVLGHDSTVTALAFSRDSQKLMGASAAGTVRVWDFSGEKPNLLHVIKASTAALYGLAIAPNGNKVACAGGDTMVRLWDVSGKTPAEMKVLGGHTKLVYSLAFSKSGRTLASGDYAGKVRLWKMTGDDLKPGPQWEANTKEITSVAFDADGQYLAVGGYDGSARVWQIAGSKHSLAAVLAPKAGVIYRVEFAPGGKRLAMAAGDYNIHVWSLAGSRSRELYVLKGHEGYVSSLGYTRDGKSLVSGSGDYTVRTWNLTLRRPKARYVPRGHLSHVYSVKFAPYGKMLASAAEDKTVRLWNVSGLEFKQRHLLKGNGYSFYSVAFAADGKTIAGGGQSNIVWIWHTVSGREIKRLTDFPSGVGSLAYTPDGGKLLCTSLKSLCLWDARNGKKLRVMDGHTTNISSAALSPDGKRALTCAGYYLYKDGKIVTKNNLPVYTDCTLRLWDVASGSQLKSFTDFEKPVYHAAFAPDGSQALSGDADCSVRVWDMGNSAELKGQGIKRPYGAVFWVAYSPDGTLVGTVGIDGKLIVWERATWKKLYEWTPSEIVRHLVFAPDGRHIALGLGTGPVYVIRIPAPKK